MNNLLSKVAPFVLTATTVAAAPAITTIPIPAPAEIVARLRPGHPRLLATAHDFDQLKQHIATEPQLQTWHDELRREAVARECWQLLA